MKREKLVLAYSGGLDTSVIVHWLNNQGYEVIALCLDLGQKVEDLDEILEKGQKAGAAKVLVENCLLYTSPSPRDGLLSRMPSSA